MKLTPKQIAQLNKLHELTGVTPHAWMKKFIHWGIKSMSGTIQDDIELERQRVDLEMRQAEFFSKASENLKAKKILDLPATKRIISLFGEDGEEARRYFAGLEETIQYNTFRELERTAPEITTKLEDIFRKNRLAGIPTPREIAGS